MLVVRYQTPPSSYTNCQHRVLALIVHVVTGPRLQGGYTRRAVGRYVGRHAGRQAGTDVGADRQVGRQVGLRVDRDYREALHNAW